MQFAVDTRGDSKVAIIEQSEWKIESAQAALDLLATVVYETGCDKMIVRKDLFSEGIFDLSTLVLGDILQKYVNYHMRLAIVGDFSVHNSTSLNDLICESNRGTQAYFYTTQEEALDALHVLE